MQSGVLMLMVMGNGEYTWERLIFVMVMSGFIFVGVAMEEKRLCVLEKGYQDYKRAVPARLIPYLI